NLHATAVLGAGTASGISSAQARSTSPAICGQGVFTSAAIQSAQPKHITRITRLADLEMLMRVVAGTPF
ncbi:MAG TPA: hypothetical protein VHI52_14255, partial [Verrucomicrobiae bacterium]|nr:hypothetical protein [Verrucomicrobiae bacterium]